MLGYDPDDEDVALDWYRLVHPDDMARVQSKMREHLEGKTPFFESVHRMLHQNGDWRWMKSRAKGVVDDNGRLLRLLGVDRITSYNVCYTKLLRGVHTSDGPGRIR